MFAEHQPRIAAWARQSPANLAAVAGFAVATANVPFKRACDGWRTWCDGARNAGDDDIRGVLYGFKRVAVVQLAETADRIHRDLEGLAAALPARAGDTMPRPLADALLAYAGMLPGLGLVKGGFFIQLAYGVSGCLDTVNVAVRGIDTRMVKRFRAIRFKELSTWERRLQRAREYTDLLVRLGGTQFLWDNWCGHMARRYPVQFASADAVSAEHCRALGLE